MEFLNWYIEGLGVACQVIIWLMATEAFVRVGCFIKRCVNKIVHKIMNKGEEENVEVG